MDWRSPWADDPPSAEASEIDEEPKAIVDFEAVFIPDEPKRAGLLIPQLAYYDIENVHLLGTNLWHSQTLIEMAAKYVQGALMTDIFLSSSAKPAVQQFVQAYQRIYSAKPGFLEAVAYDAAQIVLTVLTDDDLRFRSSIRDRLLDVDGYEGATGRTSFKADGDVEKQLFLIQALRGGFKEVIPPVAIQ
jgi:ABC-type branched-subunit amino acid transport system substrate-binding protein